MVRGMAFRDRHEQSATRGTNFSAGAQCSLDGRTVVVIPTTLAERNTESFVGVGRSSLMAYSAVTVQGGRSSPARFIR